MQGGVKVKLQEFLILIRYKIYLLTAIGLIPGGRGTIHIYTQTIHRTTQLTTLVGRLSGPQVAKIKLTMN